ncbi:MAG: hypothetical protein AABZ31_11800 [Bdellovibrionota bacterium]
MAAPILLSEYKMKKKTAKLKREAEAPVTLEFMREFRAEMMSQFATIDARFKQVDAKFDEMRAQFTEVRAQITQVSAETKTSIHQVKLLVEEQNLRNKQAYDGYAITYGALQDLKSKIKPECLED